MRWGRLVWAACLGQQAGGGGVDRYSIWRDCQAIVRFNLAGRQSHGKRFIKFGEIFSLSSIYFSQDQLAWGCTDLRQIGWAPRQLPPLSHNWSLQVFGQVFVCFTVALRNGFIKSKMPLHSTPIRIVLGLYPSRSNTLCNPHLLPAACTRCMTWAPFLA